MKNNRTEKFDSEEPRTTRQSASPSKDGPSEDASRNGQRFLKGAAILAASGLIVKVLGTILRIPLNNWLGAGGMSYYSAAYSIYSVLLIISTAGIPVAISRMVSEHLALHENRYAHKVFRVAVSMLAIIGAVSFAICFFGADGIANLFKNPGSEDAIRAIAPALLFVPIFSAFRGYANGRQNMVPTAVSEISEQLVRVFVGLALAYYLLKNAGVIEAAAGAAFGASAGSIAGLLVISLIFFAKRKKIHLEIEAGNAHVDSSGTIAKEIAIIAVPIIIGSSIMPLMNFIDTTMIMRVLQHHGWTLKQSQYLYGLLSSFCSALIAFPQFMTQAISVSLVPAISSRFRIHDTEGLKLSMNLGYRMTTLLAFPCAIGMMVLAEPILKLLYFTRPQSCHDAAPTLMIMAFGIIFLSVMQTSTSALQAVGKQMLPVRNLAIGCLFKIACTYFLVAIPALNIKGAAIGTMCTYAFAMLMNAADVRKYTGVKIDFNRTYVRPAAASVLMGVVAFALYHVLWPVLRAFVSPVLANALAVAVAILGAIVFYAFAIFAVHAVTLEEIEQMPRGEKLARVLRKFVRNAR